MDPDIPAPSIEHDQGALPVAKNMSTTPPMNTTTPSKPTPRRPTEPARTQASASPLRSAYHTPVNSRNISLSPRPPSRSPSVASSHRGERQSTPILNTKRSTSSLSTARGSTPSLHPLVYRRSSSNLNPATPAANGKTAAMNVPERPPVTANSVAKEYFEKELEAHASLQSQVVVLVHDACYGHRFARPKATKNALASIVERPERILATLLGAAAAYVRLGGRHQDGPYMPRPKHDPAAVKDMPFQIRKTSRVIPLNHASVTYIHGTKWMEELQIMCDFAEAKLTTNAKELVRPIGYGKDESGNALPKLHEGDLYLCGESLNALQGCLGGVCDAVDTVFASGPTRRAFVCIRPPGHHCSSNFPSGFCWLNNVHVGISYAAMNHGLTHAAIIDFDLHHGDGSQNIAWDQNRKAQTAAKNAASHKKTPIGYYSLHDINSYPCEWGDDDKVRNASLCIENAHGQSIWNVHLEPWKSLEDFWKLYDTKYAILLEKARTFLRIQTAKLRATGNLQPRGAIFISAGFDASEWESAGMQRHSVNVPTEFYARITADLVKLSQEEDLGVDGRLISVLEGGYSDRALTSGVLSHICGLAGDVAPAADSGSDSASAAKFQTINNWTPEVTPTTNGTSPSLYRQWWATDNLEALEAVVAGRQPATAKSLQDKTGNYSSPTHASTARMTGNAREKHSLSALQARLSLEAQYVPPPPDVDWAVASYELSRVIIPSDRQTLSCTHEELNAEATKARRERQSNIGVAIQPDERMQLRDRRSKVQAAAYGGPRTSSRNENRRTTIAAVSELPDPSLPQFANINTRPRRRSSDASSILSSFQGMKLSEEPDNVSTKPSANHNGNGTRGSSTASDKTTKAVAVKKTRAPPVTKAPAKAKTSPRKPKAGLPAFGSSSSLLKAEPSTSQSTVQPAINGGERGPSGSSQEGTNSVAKTDEMENLANSMKKISIKLKVPSQEEHAARQQKFLDEKQKKPRVTRKLPVPKVVKTTKPDLPAPSASYVPIQPKPETIPVAELSGGPPVDQSRPTAIPTYPQKLNHLAMANGHSQEPQKPTQACAEAEPALPSAPSYSFVDHGQPSAPAQSHLSQPSPITSDAFNASRLTNTYPPPPAYAQQLQPIQDQAQLPGYQSERVAGPEVPIQTIPWPPTMPPMTPTKRTKEDLPMFNSHSPIPFGGMNPIKEEMKQQDSSVWTVPETTQTSKDGS